MRRASPPTRVGGLSLKQSPPAADRVRSPTAGFGNSNDQIRKRAANALQHLVEHFLDGKCSGLDLQRCGGRLQRGHGTVPGHARHAPGFPRQGWKGLAANPFSNNWFMAPSGTLLGLAVRNTFTGRRGIPPFPCPGRRRRAPAPGPGRRCSRAGSRTAGHRRDPRAGRRLLRPIRPLTSSPSSRTRSPSNTAGRSRAMHHKSLPQIQWQTYL